MISGELYLGHSSLPFLSTLRLYLPPSAFTDAERTLIEQNSPLVTERMQTDVQELADSLNRTVFRWPALIPPPDTERVRSLQLHEGSPVIFNISQLRLRTVETMVHLASGPSRPLAELIFDRETIAELEAQLPDGQEPLTRTSSWGIPFSWFVLISEGDRTEVVESQTKVITVRVQVPLPVAVERLEGAISILENSAPELDLLEELRSLRAWIDGLDPEGAMELDYGAIADRIYPDDSPMDVRLGLESIAEGDLTGAAAAYRRLASRWIPIRQLARAS
ncbi:hypothetical protein ODZ83_09295 [Acaricomes phytoseiuli]|uniref:hypothetical protein n=1 Tax=Acaricomes phytoseiuli TaxID=291968 RepID=UPI0003821E16|nr:hypothetical protein [Acaricomes phytoseiuli]MCW1250370.1 hypothetical protein [Acaricomes phytoseiuli]